MAHTGNNKAWSWQKLEELLICPVCFEPPLRGIVEQCRTGHHICANCKPKLVNCPLCTSEYTGTRNYAIEELARHYKVLKDIWGTGKRSKSKPPVQRIVIPRQVHLATPPANKGIYPCRVGECNVELPQCRLLNHVRTYHPKCLTEAVVNGNDSYTHTWTFNKGKGGRFTRHSFVIFVSGIGLVFLTIECLCSGEIVTYIQMAMKLTDAEKFFATIKFLSDTSTAMVYNTKLISVRQSEKGILQDRSSFFVIGRRGIRKICNQQQLKVQLTLSRYNPSFHTLSTSPREQLDNVANKRLAQLT